VVILDMSAKNLIRMENYWSYNEKSEIKNL